MKVKIPSHILFAIVVLLFSISVTIHDNIKYSNIQKAITIASVNRPEIQSVCPVSSADNNYMAYLCTGYDVVPVEIRKNSTKNNTVSVFSKAKNVSLWIIADSKQHPGHHFRDKDFGVGNNIIINTKRGTYKFIITRKDWWSVETNNHIDIYTNNNDGKQYSETEFIAMYNNPNALVMQTDIDIGIHKNIVILYAINK
jgi:hypothetical protein